jgi:hypothetical protein
MEPRDKTTLISIHSRYIFLKIRNLSKASLAGAQSLTACSEHDRVQRKQQLQPLHPPLIHTLILPSDPPPLIPPLHKNTGSSIDMYSS